MKMAIQLRVYPNFGRLLLVALILLLATVAGVEAKQWNGKPIVNTKDGLVKGLADSHDTLVWKAIPYAAPPVGDLRWKEPADPDPWNEVRAESEFGAWCPQLSYAGVIGSEDCLYLNVWRPDNMDKDLPVFVWIHGGGNSLGSAAQDGYKGAYFADRNNAVFVSFNYRLGPMGWFAHPSLREETAVCDSNDWTYTSEDQTLAKSNSGNYATLDMIKALRWVKKNITAFGGDKSNVTIAGESAGAHNVLSLLLSPLAIGHFNKAVVMSAPNQPGYSMEIAELSANQTLARLLVSDGLASSEDEAYGVIAGMTDEEIGGYLRSKSAAELISSYDTIAPFTMLSIPTILTDGTVIVAEGSQAFADGTYPNKVPTIIGSTKDEMKLFMASFLENIETYFIGLGFPQGAGYTIAAGYNSELWRAKGTDSIAAAMVAQPDQPPVFSFQFLWGANASAEEPVVDPTYSFIFGAHHGRDIEFFLGNADSVDDSFGIPLNSEANLPGRQALTDTVIDYLGNFMRTGDPNGAGLPVWPLWSDSPGGDKLITLDADLTDTIIGTSDEALTEEGILNEMNSLYGPDITRFILSFSII